MAIEFTQERFYPSVRKPGVFLIDPEESSELWEQLTGIDNTAIDRFKFSLGSWVEVNNNKQKIILYPIPLINDETFENIKNNLVGTVFDNVPNDIFVGLPIVSTQSDLVINKDDLSFLTKNILPIYHDRESSDYSNTTSPLTIQFGVNYFRRLNPNEQNIFGQNPDNIILPTPSFQSDISFLNKTARVFSNFDWYNDSVWRGGGGPNQPGEPGGGHAGRHDDVISDIEGPPEDRDRGEWQDADFDIWHRFEYALPSFKGRHPLTQKYVDARGTLDDVGGNIVHSLGDKIGISLDTNDPYTNGTADNIDNNHLGLNLEDLIGITKETMGSAFNPSNYSTTGNMEQTSTTFFDQLDENIYFMRLVSRYHGPHGVQLWLEFHDDIQCAVDLRVGDRVAFNIIDVRNEMPKDTANGEYSYHRGRRISRPPLGVGRQYEYTVTGFSIDVENDYDPPFFFNRIYLDSFLDDNGPFYLEQSSGDSEKVLFYIYTNDILAAGDENNSWYSSNADIIQIYRREDDFDEDDDNIPSIAHKNKLYLFYRQQSNQDIEDWAKQYSVNENDKAIQFNTHGSFGLALTDSYFKDMPMVDEFLTYTTAAVRSKYFQNSFQGNDPLRNQTTGKMEGFYFVEGDPSVYGRNGVNSLLKLQDTGIFKNQNQTNSENPIPRLEGVYTTKASLSNGSANVEHYSYRAFSFRYLNRRKQNEIDENFGPRGWEVFYRNSRAWISILGYDASTVGTNNNYGKINLNVFKDVETNGIEVVAPQNTSNVDLDSGGYTIVNNLTNDELTLPKAGKNYKRNLTYGCRLPCDFFIKYRMNKSDFAGSVLSGQENSLDIELDDYDDRITTDGYVKISKSKFYQIIPDITVYNSKNAKIVVTVGVGAKRKGIADRNYLNSYNETTFALDRNFGTITGDWFDVSGRVGGINISPNGDDIRLTDAARYQRSNGDGVFKHLTSKYFTALIEDETVIPFIRLSWQYDFDENTDEQISIGFGMAGTVGFVLGHIDMIELPYDFTAGASQQTLIENYVKYHVLDWGDGPEPMTEDKIRQTEFFSIYDQEPDDIDKFQVKNLMQTVEIAKPIYENGVLNLTSHTYTEPGVKNIKTLIFKLDTAGTAIYETILLNTSIVVNSVSTLLQDFNAFGASEFNVLPLSNTDKELIVGGGISSDSNYVSSLSSIDTSNAYGSDDFVEKEYYNNFKKSLDSGSYGENINLDLSTVRFFDKPKNLFDFITNDIDGLITSNLSIQDLPTNSSATDIFINSTDCKFELGMNDANGIMIENTSNSNESGILIGDYSLIKEEGEDIKKEDEMDIPEFERDSTKQAF